MIRNQRCFVIKSWYGQVCSSPTPSASILIGVDLRPNFWQVKAMPEKSVTELSRDLRMLYNRGQDALQRENFDYAVELFTQVLTQEPRVFEIRKLLRQAQTQKAGAGRGYFKKMFSSASSSPLLAKGQLALRRDPLEAIAIAEQIIAGDATSAGGHNLLAEAALAADLPQTALLSLEILTKQSPKDKALNLRLAEAHSLAGEKTRAEQVLAALQREYPMDNEISMALKNISANKTMDEGGYGALADGSGSYRDILKNKEEAVSLEQEKRQVKAEDVTDRLIREREARLKTEPGNLKSLKDLGDLYVEKGDYDRALEYYAKIAAADAGNDASLQRRVGEIKLRKLDLAISKLDPNAADFTERAAQLKAERIAFQLAECQQRADQYPTDLEIRFELGKLLLEAGKVTEAIPEFQKAQSNPHRRIQAMNHLAQCFAKRGMNEMASRRLQEALKEKLVFDDEKKELTYTLGCVLEKMGKREEALKQFEQIYEVDIGYKDVGAKVDSYYADGGAEGA